MPVRIPESQGRGLPITRVKLGIGDARVLEGFEYFGWTPA